MSEEHNERKEGTGVCPEPRVVRDEWKGSVLVPSLGEDGWASIVRQWCLQYA